ncbi:hypothetical protein [Actinopolymorpha sp. B9G3]|uniref:hypothetical protein n=1 Tax=Actinopolymorpha sp. B9G3 TaxID=3158970 RepID=UPI0032D97FDB
MTHYFRRRWEEPRGDEHDDWGHSDWYFEVGDDGWVSRQVESYDRGPILRYDLEHQEDEYGGLSVVPLDIDEFEPFEIPREAFEAVWRKMGVG